jgi:G3E family GTPase
VVQQHIALLDASFLIASSSHGTSALYRCCSVRGDILGAFASILEAVDSGKPLDAIVIETTGMADPVPIVRTLLQTPAITSRCKLNGVVTLIDSKNVIGRLRETEADAGPGSAAPDEAFQQIMFSDRIVLNKIDLVSSTEAIEVFNRLRGTVFVFRPNVTLEDAIGSQVCSLA